MRKISIALSFFSLTLFASCITQDNSGEIDKLREELTAEIDALKNLLESNSTISEIKIEGNNLVLVFSDGGTISTALPEQIMPSVGENGNWWIGETDLGVPAESEVPIIGANGNWWVSGEDTGIKFEVTDGQDGQDGLTPYVGTNGNWWIGSTDTEVPAAGQDGTDGIDGESPYIGANGNWWIGTTDTGVVAEGQDGIDGIDGNGISTVSYDQTSGILTIMLDDGTEYEFLLSYEASLTGVKLNDLNGEYMLSAIYNGDLPFVSFEYDASNRLETITYNTTVLNETVKYLTIDRTYTAGGDIQTQTYSEWATKKKAIQNGDVLPDKELGIEMTYQASFDEIFDSGLSGYSGTGADFWAEVGNYTYIFKDSLIYYAVEEYNEDTEAFDYFVRKHMVRQTFGSETFGIAEVGAEGVYIWTPYYDIVDDEENWTTNYLYASSAYDSRFMYHDGGSIVLGSPEGKTYYPWGQVAIAVGADPIDDTSVAGIVEDYMATTEASYENPAGGISVAHKTIFKRYNTYEPGDLIDSYTLNYTYSGENFIVDGDIDGNNEDIVNVTVTDGKVTNVAMYNPDILDFEDVLGFSYVGGQLSTISFIKENAPDLVSISYDGQGNPVSFSVNPSLLQPSDGQGTEGVDPEVLASLGLIYSYDEYDSDLGMVVEKYHYPDAYTPMIQIDYNYDMKNFMNHTFTAANPLLSFFELPNAIGEVKWAGHGSAIFMEYEKFNDGGYPTQIKTYLQVSASDVPLDIDEELEDFGIPINGSVAVTYNLEYIEKL